MDGDGRILDDRSETVRPWVGRHYRELPDPVSVVVVVDPLIVLGCKELDDRPAVGGQEQFKASRP